MESVSKRALRLQQKVASITMTLSFTGLILAVVLLWNKQVSWLDILLLLVMYSITTLGISMGFHRYFTHRAFKTGKVIQFLLGVAGSMAMQGPVLFWVASHRCHHKYSDMEGDPHSPNVPVGKYKSKIMGFLYAHVGWMFNHQIPRYSQYINDLRNNKLVLMVNKYYAYWVALGMLIPGVIGYLATFNIKDSLVALCWGGPIRLFLLHNTTWSVNSICHLFGSRDYETKDDSRNNPYVALLTFGEGWHNNHHAFPYSARHGLRWFQLDVSYLLIRSLRRLGLVWDVKLPIPSSPPA